MGTYDKRKKEGFTGLPQRMQAYVTPIKGKSVVPTHDNKTYFRRKPIDERDCERIGYIRPNHERINGQIKPA